MRFFRTLLLYLMNNERLINKLAESKPIRKAAQMVVYMLARSGSLHGTPKSISNPEEFVEQIRNIAELFKKNLKKLKDDDNKKPPK